MSIFILFIIVFAVALDAALIVGGFYTYRRATSAGYRALGLALLAGGVAMLLVMVLLIAFVTPTSVATGTSSL